MGIQPKITKDRRMCACNVHTLLLYGPIMDAECRSCDAGASRCPTANYRRGFGAITVYRRPTCTDRPPCPPTTLNLPFHPSQRSYQPPDGRRPSNPQRGVEQYQRRLAIAVTVTVVVVVVVSKHKMCRRWPCSTTGWSEPKSGQPGNKVSYLPRERERERETTLFFARMARANLPRKGPRPLPPHRRRPPPYTPAWRPPQPPRPQCSRQAVRCFFLPARSTKDYSFVFILAELARGLAFSE
jgi:hypothetical protein